MIQQISKSIQKEKLFGEADKILLAVSGGIDSVVMLNILSKYPNPMGIAHLNHSLRGEESETDARFVEDLALDYKLPYHYKRIDIKAISDQKKANVSDTGHEERYKFFQNMADTEGYTKIATAHHADDVVESYIMRSMEGAGLQGISGIPRKNGIIIRPLLHVHRDEIIDYASAHGLAYREDSSNQKLDYRRNAIRAIIRPALTKLRPSSDKGIKQAADIAHDTHEALKSLTRVYAEQQFDISDDKVKIPVSSLDFEGSKSVLYYYLSDFGFNRTQVFQILNNHHPGAQFYSKSHTILIDRDMIILQKKNPPQRQAPILISGLGKFNILVNSYLQIKESDSFEMVNDPLVEIIPQRLIDFPLYIRGWQEGDKFRPIGMKGRSKSIQDYLVDIKLPRTEKGRIRLLVDQEDNIIWVLGHRLSDDYRVEDSDQALLRLEYMTDQS